MNWKVENVNTIPFLDGLPSITWLFGAYERFQLRFWQITFPFRHQQSDSRINFREKKINKKKILHDGKFQLFHWFIWFENVIAITGMMNDTNFKQTAKLYIFSEYSYLLRCDFVVCRMALWECAKLFRLGENEFSVRTKMETNWKMWWWSFRREFAPIQSSSSQAICSGALEREDVEEEDDDDDNVSPSFWWTSQVACCHSVDLWFD